MKKFSDFRKEDFGGAVAANNVGQGQIAGVGVGPSGEPPGPRGLLNKSKRMTRRRTPVNEARTTDIHYKIFDCNAQRFYDCRLGRRKYPYFVQYIGNDSFGEEIKQFAVKNPKSGIILRNKSTKELQYIRYPR